MYVHTDSSVWSCCVNKTMTKGSHGYERTNVMTQPIQDIINNDYFKQLRLDMLNDVKNENCIDCYALENSSGRSYRNDFNEQFKEHFTELLKTNDDGSIDDFETIYLDFRFSNLCNFKCRSCRPEWSSNWAKETKDNKDHPYKIWDDNIPKHDLTEEQFIDRFEGTLKTVERLYFAG